MGTPVYRDLDAETIELQYQPSRHVPSLQHYLDEYSSLGVAARDAVEHRRIAYGNHADEWLWYVPAIRPEAPLFVFVHGGFWRRLSADDGSLLAPGARTAGCAFATVNYTLCPAAPLDVLVDQTRRAVEFLIDHAADLRHDASRVHVAGHSAGGHLAAMVARTDPRPAGYVFVSGIYDVTPIVYTTINDDLRLTPDDAARLSPLLLGAPSTTASAIVAWGSRDTDEFRRQSVSWADAWGAAAPAQATQIEAAGRNHFDVIYDLFDPRTDLGRAVAAQVTGFR